MIATDRQPGLIPQRDAQAEAIGGSISNQIAATAKPEPSPFSDFLSRLDAFAPNDEVPDQTRINIIMILGIIIEGLQPFLQHQVGRLDTGEDLVTDNSSIVFMKRMLNTIKDLDNGKIHASLLKNYKGKTASHQINDQEFIDVQLEIVDMVKLDRGFITRREAELHIGRAYRKSGKKFHGKPITAELLKSWRDRRAAKEVK